MSFACPAFPVVPRVRFLGTYSSATGGTGASFASVDFGPEADDRVIVVVAGHRAAAGRTHSEQTIGGVSAVEHVDVQFSVMGLSIFSARPTGTSGTIAYTLSATTDHWWIAVYAIYGLASATATDTDIVTGIDPLPFFALTVLSGGVVIAGGAAATTTAYTTTGLTEGADETVETGQYVAGSAQNVVGATAFSASFDTNTATACAGAVSFR